MVELTEKQVQALEITQAALVQIRILARQPVTPKTMAAIHDLADALHNVPHGVTRRAENSNLANMFDEELDQDVATAVGVFRREGFPMFAFPPDIPSRDEDRSAYVASGARFWIPPGIADQYATAVGIGSRRGKQVGSSLALFFRRIFG
ncbi:hypothetical protein P3T23_008054 [Paraburkholderia sp. GAS448]|uniref:hypothetical protein n=1 Tax=Paraburkholderia sp. GAS448 TaxID=3035136 RepID=UPI003D19757D